MSEQNPPRITLHSIFQTLLEQFHLEKGIGYTIKQLFINPKSAIDEYFYHDRKRMIKPSRFLLLTVAVATFLSYQFLGIGDEFMETLRNDPAYKMVPEAYRPALDQLNRLINQYFNLLFMISLPFLSLATYLIYKNRHFNYAEHLVLNTYSVCIQNIFFILTVPVINLSEAISLLQGVLALVYMVYFYIQVFEQKLWPGLGRFILVYFLSQMMVSLLLGAYFGILLLLQ